MMIFVLKGFVVMGFVTLNCPSCGANIQLDESREFGFCSYCGTKVLQDKIVVEHRGSIAIEHKNEIDNLLLRAADMMNKRLYDDAERYYNRVLDYDYNNQTARKAMDILYKIVKEPNLFVSVASGTLYSKSAQVIVYIDKNKIAVLPSGSHQAFTLPVGKHILAFKIRNTFAKSQEEIIINDRFTKINVSAICKFGNRIEILKSM